MKEGKKKKNPANFSNLLSFEKLGKASDPSLELKHPNKESSAFKTSKHNFKLFDNSGEGNLRNWPKDSFTADDLLNFKESQIKNEGHSYKWDET